MIRATTTYDGKTLVAVLARPNWANGSCDVTVATKTEIETTRHGKEYRRPSADKPIVSKISYTATLKGQDAQDWRTMQAFIGPKRVIVPVWPDARISAKFNPAHKTDYVIGWDVGFTNVAVGLRALPPDRDYLSSAIIGRLSIPDNDTVLNGVDGDVKVEVNNAEVMTFNWEEKPTITQQSEGGAYLAGETVNLFVVASGTQPITYQWYLDGEPISGATSAEYSFTMAEAYEGSYTCVASNALGSDTSDDFLILIRIPTTWTLRSDTNIEAEGSNVFSWVTTDGFHLFSQGISGPFPTIDSSDQLNGKSPVRFQNQYLRSGDVALRSDLPYGDSARTISCLLRCRNASGTGGDTSYCYVWGQAHGPYGDWHTLSLGARRSGSKVWWIQGGPSNLPYSSEKSDTADVALLTIWYDGSTINLYLNSEIIATRENQTLATRDGDMVLGSWYSELSERVADCSIWELSVWDSAISSYDLSGYIREINQRYGLSLT